MSPVLRIVFLLFALLLAAAPARAVLLGDVPGPVDLSAHVEWLEDAPGLLTAEQVRSPEVAARFAPLPASDPVLNPGFTTSVFWLRVRFGAAGNAPRDWLLEIPYGALNALDFHAPGRSIVATGSDRSLDSRPYFHRHFVFPVVLGASEDWFYFRVASRSSLTVPVLAWQPDAFRRHEARGTLLQYMYYGGLLALLIYNVFLFLAVRDVRYLIYSCYATAFGLAMFSGNGFGRLFLWPDAPAFDEIAQGLFLYASAFFAVQFSRSFFRIGERNTVLDALLGVSGWAFVAVAALLIASLRWDLPLGLLTQFGIFNGFAMAALVLAASVRFQMYGVREARFFLAGWSILWVGSLAAGLRMLGMLPTNGLTLYVLQIASALEMLLLALALADLMSSERRSREQAQALAMESQKRMLDTLRASEEELERTVAQRTAQLEVALGEQKEVLDQYVRFASLIAHEFRNPLGIVEGQLALLRKELERGLGSAEGTVRRLTVASGATRRLATMFDRWLQGDRIRRGVQELNVERVALAPWLRQVLDENAHRFAGHPVELRVPGEATLHADPQMLDMAVINLLENAAKYSPPGSPIAVEWRRRPGAVGVAVLDRGPGIPAGLREQVFSDFFRVDPEGAVRGLGLGLSIVRRVVDAHGGQVELGGTEGQGADFCIWMPESGAKEK